MRDKVKRGTAIYLNVDDLLTLNEASSHFFDIDGMYDVEGLNEKDFREEQEFRERFEKLLRKIFTGSVESRSIRR